MSKQRTDIKSKSDTTGEENEEETLSELKPDEEKSGSTMSTSSSEEGDKCMNPVDFLARKAKGLGIDKTKKSEPVTGKSKRKADASRGAVRFWLGITGFIVPTGGSKKSKRALDGIKSPVSMASGLNEIGLDFDSEFEPTTADAVVIKGQKRKGKEQQDTDVFQGWEADSEEVCNKTKNQRKNDDDTHDQDGAEGAGAHTNLSGLGFQVAGK